MVPHIPNLARWRRSKEQEQVSHNLGDEYPEVCSRLAVGICWVAYRRNFESGYLHQSGYLHLSDWPIRKACIVRSSAIYIFISNFIILLSNNWKTYFNVLRNWNWKSGTIFVNQSRIVLNDDFVQQQNHHKVGLPIQINYNLRNDGWLSSLLPVTRFWCRWSRLIELVSEAVRLLGKDFLIPTPK